MLIIGFYGNLKLMKVYKFRKLTNEVELERLEKILKKGNSSHCRGKANKMFRLEIFKGKVVLLNKNLWSQK